MSTFTIAHSVSLVTQGWLTGARHDDDTDDADRMDVNGQLKQTQAGLQWTAARQPLTIR